MANRIRDLFMMSSLEPKCCPHDQESRSERTADTCVPSGDDVGEPHPRDRIGTRALRLNKVRALLDFEAQVAYISKIDRESLNSITLLRDMTGQVEFCDERTQVSEPMARDAAQ
jgi:hypothetical protein